MPFPVGEEMEKDTHTHKHTRTDRDAKSRILVIYSIVPVEGLSGCRRHLVMNRISFVSQHTIHPTV